MTFLYKNIFFLVLCFYSSISLDLYSMENTINEEDKIENRFKIGFEFQEGTHLCEWAKGNKNFQKVPLFEIWNIQDKKLCYHVEIDGDDIELVTRPFTNEEEEQLAECITSIKYTLEILKNLFCYYSHPANAEKREENTPVSVTFNEWIIELRKFLAEDGVYQVCVKEGETQQCTGRTLSEMTLVFPKKGVEKSNWSFEEILNWSPVFVSHVTLQHRLELTIPIYLTLFGDETSLRMALPHKGPLDILLEQEEFDWEEFKRLYVNKENGLIFLHAFTLLRMVPFNIKVKGIPILHRIESLGNIALELDRLLLQETLSQYRDSGQIDIKGRLLIMSRRPFSELFKGVVADKNIYQGSFINGSEEISYINAFITAMHDYDYSGFEKYMRLFSKVNYGEQFFSDDGNTIDLRGFNECFTSTFKKSNEKLLNDLLKEGIVTIAMIRNFHEDVLIEDTNPRVTDSPVVIDLFEGSNWYDLVLASVQSPEKTYIIKYKNELGILAKDFLYDILSPAYFMHDEDSMGRIKDMKGQDPAFGEAIIESRAISSVNQWFLDLHNLSDEHNELSFFLRYTYNNISNQAVQLFRFLKTFKVSDPLIKERILQLLKKIKELKDV